MHMSTQTVLSYFRVFQRILIEPRYIKAFEHSQVMYEKTYFFGLIANRFPVKVQVFSKKGDFDLSDRRLKPIQGASGNKVTTKKLLVYGA